MRDSPRFAIQTKNFLKLERVIEYDDLDALTVEGTTDEEDSQHTLSGLLGSVKSAGGAFVHRGRASDPLQVECSREDLADMIRTGTELLGSEASSGRVKIGRLVLDVTLTPQSKNSLGHAISQAFMKDTRRMIREVKEAACKSGSDALASEDLDLIQPVLREVEVLREKLIEQLDEVKAIKNSYWRRIQNLDNTRKIEESIELTRRYEMSAYSTPRSVSRLEESTPRAIESTLGKQEDLEKELLTLQERLKESGGNPRDTSKISTRISRIKTELQSLKTNLVISRTKTMRGLNMSVNFDMERPASVCSVRRSTSGVNWADQSIDCFDNSAVLSSEVMREQLALRRDRQDLEEQCMKTEIETHAARRKLEMQTASLNTQKEQLQAERKQIEHERNMLLQFSRDNLRRRSEVQLLVQRLWGHLSEEGVSVVEDLQRLVSN
jgi:hypothetical protein